MKTTLATGNRLGATNKTAWNLWERHLPAAPLGVSQTRLGRDRSGQECPSHEVLSGALRKRPHAGFTLIELSIAVFIIAIIMAVSVPSFVRSYNTAVLSEAGRSVVTACELARLNAVLHQRKVVFHVDLDKQMIWLTQPPAADATGAADSVDSPDALLKTIEVSPRIGLASAQVADQPPQQKGEVDALFYPNGTCDGFTVTFRGAEKGSGLAIVVDSVTSRGVAWSVKL
jgi:prepilin-type N-terminal cleavage/methylation domain-containing protein